jgi:hypothetical protein
LFVMPAQAAALSAASRLYAAKAKPSGQSTTKQMFLCSIKTCLFLRPDLTPVCRRAEMLSGMGVTRMRAFARRPPPQATREARP